MSDHREPYRKLRQRQPNRSRRRARTAEHRRFIPRSSSDLPPIVRVMRCSSGKLGYFVREDAELALAGIDQHQPRRRERRVYQCPICGGWHLTSQPLKRELANAGRDVR